VNCAWLALASKMHALAKAGMGCSGNGRKLPFPPQPLPVLVKLQLQYWAYLLLSYRGDQSILVLAGIHVPFYFGQRSPQAAGATDEITKTAGFQPFLTPFSASYRRYTAYRRPLLGLVRPLTLSIFPLFRPRDSGQIGQPVAHSS